METIAGNIGLNVQPAYITDFAAAMLSLLQR